MAQTNEPQTLLAALVAQQQLSWDEAARKVRDASDAHEQRPASITARHLARLARRERGDGRPTPVICRALQYAFKRPIEELLAPYGSNVLIRPSHTKISPGTSEVLTVASDRARRFVSQLQTSSGEALDLAYEDVRDLVQVYPTRPLNELLPHLVSTQDTIFSFLERPQRPNHARQLYFLSAVVGGMLAKASHDLADPHAALTQSRTAWLCAEQVDHNGLKAWISGLQSLVAYWARRPHDSIRYAQRGAQFAAISQSTAGVWLAANESRAWAALGNAERTREALLRTEDAWSTVRPDDLDELGGMATFTRSRQLYYAADALTWLPEEADAAHDYSTAAVDAYADPMHQDWAFGDAAGSRCDLAIARINGGDLDGARQAIDPVLDLPADQRINGIIHSVNRVHAALTTAEGGAVGRGLQEEIETYTRISAQALPR